MKISQKGLYALQAMMMLARHYNQGAIRIRDIAYEEELPEKFLELILLELKNARRQFLCGRIPAGEVCERAIEDQRSASAWMACSEQGGERSPFGDAEQLRSLIDRDAEHRALYQVFLDVRNAAAKILESTSLADIMNPSPSSKKGKKRKTDADVLPMLVHASGGKGEK